MPNDGIDRCRPCRVIQQKRILKPYELWTDDATKLECIWVLEGVIINVGLAHRSDKLDALDRGDTSIY